MNRLFVLNDFCDFRYGSSVTNKRLRLDNGATIDRGVDILKVKDSMSKLSHQLKATRVYRSGGRNCFQTWMYLDVPALLSVIAIAIPNSVILMVYSGIKTNMLFCGGNHECYFSVLESLGTFGSLEESTNAKSEDSMWWFLKS